MLILCNLAHLSHSLKYKKMQMTQRSKVYFSSSNVSNKKSVITKH